MITTVLVLLTQVGKEGNAFFTSHENTSSNSIHLYIYIYIFFFFKAHNDHFDLVSRRMGFIPLPLGSLVSSFREKGKGRVRQGYSLFITDRVRASRSADPKVPVSRVNL